MSLIKTIFIITTCFICWNKTAPSVTDLLLEIVPFDEIKIVLDKHLKDDEGFRAALVYLNSPDWEEMVQNLLKSLQFQECNDFLKKNGFDMEVIFKRFEQIFKSYNVSTLDVDVSKADLKKTVNDLEDNLLTPLMKNIDKLKQDPMKWTQLMSSLTALLSPDAMKLLIAVQEAPEMKVIIKQLNKMGVNELHLKSLPLNI